MILNFNQKQIVNIGFQGDGSQKVLKKWQSGKPPGKGDNTKTLLIDVSSDVPNFVNHNRFYLALNKVVTSLRIKTFIKVDDDCFLEGGCILHFDPIGSSMVGTQSDYFYLDSPQSHYQYSSGDKVKRERVIDLLYIEIFAHKGQFKDSKQKQLEELLNQYAQTCIIMIKKPQKDQGESEVHQSTGNDVSSVTNLILQGPPGTGKSYRLSQQTHKDDQVMRIVCHPEMTNAHFIGTYRPQKDKDDKSKLTYDFQPGPLTKVLRQALVSYLGDEPIRHILIIEEINRANAAALFAEAFQLLDRTKNGWSEHATDLGDDVIGYLGDDLMAKMKLRFKTENPDHALADSEGVRLPPNLFLWATMNTADQGVFPMDTAFKRRWTFDYLGVDDSEEVWMNSPWNPHIDGESIELKWQELRQAINASLEAQGIDEDRQLGAFFLNESELTDSEKLKEHITNKVIAYLRDDVLRYEPYKLFKKTNNQVPGFAKLRATIKNDGLLAVIDSDDFKSKLKAIT
jgi:hypothetical protein